MWITFIKLICLYLAIKYTYVNTARIIKNKNVSNGNTTLMAMGIAGFLFLQFLL